MDTIANLKEQAVTQTPLLLFDVTLANGEMERWATHGVTVDSESYAARVLRHNLFEVQAASEHGIDAIPKISLTLANADSELSQIESSVGFKGAKTQATFLFYDLVGDEPASEAMVVFQGILNPPEQVTEETLRVTAVNRMSMQRVLLPPVRLERRCPWTFPSTAQERQEAVDGGAEGDSFAILPVRLFGGRVGRRGESGRRVAVHELRFHAVGLHGARHVRRR